MKIAFLVYDSRSGSTLLSRELSERLGDTFVTPEIGFDSLLKFGDRNLREQGWGPILKKMYSGHEFINLNLPYERVFNIVNSVDGGMSISDGICAILREYANENSRGDCHWIILKNGSHLRFIKELRKYFNDDLHFLYIVRDPRAVVSSKLITKRPYHPHEMMAWGGAVISAIRWKKNFLAVIELISQDVPVLVISYENLVRDCDSEIFRIVNFLQITNKQGVTYEVPDQEKEIHTLVSSEGIQEKRTEAWMDELSYLNKLRVEAVCFRQMKLLNYQVSSGVFVGFVRILAVISDFPKMLYKVFVHFIRDKKPKIKLLNNF